jgi:hypothetical protein
VVAVQAASFQLLLVQAAQAVVVLAVRQIQTGLLAQSIRAAAAAVLIKITRAAQAVLEL